MAIPNLPAQGSTAWYPWAADLDAAARQLQSDLSGSGFGVAPLDASRQVPRANLPADIVAAARQIADLTAAVALLAAGLRQVNGGVDPTASIYDARGLALTAFTVTPTATVTPVSVSFSWTLAKNPTLSAVLVNEVGIQVTRDGVTSRVASTSSQNITNSTVLLTGSASFTAAGTYALTPYYVVGGTTYTFPGSIAAKTLTLTASPDTAPPDQTPRFVEVSDFKAVVADGGSTVNLSWAAPTSTAVTGYTVTRDQADTAGTVGWTATTQGTTFQFTLLVPSTTYSFTVTPVAPDGQVVTKTVTLKPINGTTGTTPTPTTPVPDTTSSLAVRNLRATADASSVTVAWDAPSNASTITGYKVGRNGTDLNGSGAWETTVEATNRQQTFSLLRPTDYVFTVTPLSSGAELPPSTTTTAKPTGAGTPTTGGGTGYTPGTGTGSLKAQKVVMPSRGWFSGGSGHAIDYNNAAFGNWRGSKVDAVATWMDAANGGAWGGGLGGGGNAGPAGAFKGLVDIALGGPSDYSAAKNGSLDSNLRSALGRIKSARTIDGVLYPTILRPFHEMNGTWYAWSVSSGEVTDFKATAKRWSQIINEVWPQALVGFCPNGETTSGIQVASLYEDGVWDIIGADRYNQYPYIGTNRAGGYTSWADGSTRGSDSNPVGIETWRKFALNRGLPLYIPEYANNGYDSGTPGNGGDDPYWVQQFFAWAKANAGNGPGKVFADIWFNQVGKEEDRWPVYRTDGGVIRAPKVAAAYQTFFKALG